MIRTVHIRNFKKFQDQTFDLGGHVVLAGPNNMGKTTLLQAISAWNVGLQKWREAGDFANHKEGYTFVPVSKQSFTAVSVRNFAWLWNEQQYRKNGQRIEITVTLESGAVIPVEFRPDTSEQIFVRPKKSADVSILREDVLSLTYVPPMSGLSIQEPVYQGPKLDQLLGMGKPGDVIRNLLLEALRGPGWEPLVKSMGRLFGIELLPPDGSGADIVANFRYGSGPSFDISSGGSGMQQVLMLLTILHARPGSVLLLDEPDAHLHVFLQDSIYSELKSVASQNRSQLILATHSEVIINSAEPKEVQLMLGGKPRRLGSDQERDRLGEALRVLTHADVMMALDSPGILYVEGYTDLNLLREWARILGHPVHQWLSTKPFWKALNWVERLGGDGVKSRDHFKAIQLIREDARALEIRDGDGKPEEKANEKAISGSGFQGRRWRRYEIESYLVIPDVLERFIAHQAGEAQLHQSADDLAKTYQDLLGAEELVQKFRQTPHAPPRIVESFLEKEKARDGIIPRILGAGGLQGIPYTNYWQIAELMTPAEIHPDVITMLDDIKQALGL